MKVSVIIPTIGREAFLRTALHSVAAQTIRDQIGEIVLSDNRPCGVSEKVAAEFPALPIRIVSRTPSLAANAHFKALYFESRHEYTAILHDDDWWSPVHLASALNLLETNKTTAACYSAFAEIPGEASPAYADPSLGPWFAGHGLDLAGTKILDFTAVCLASLPNTFGRFSALVARADALREASYVHELGNPFDTDRQLAVALAQKAPLIYSPLATVYIRRHSSQDGGRFSTNEVNAHMSTTTLWILTQAKERKIDLHAAIARALNICPPELHAEVARLWNMPWTRQILKSENLWPAVFTPHLNAPLTPTRLGARDFIPPVLLTALRSLLRRNND